MSIANAILFQSSIPILAVHAGCCAVARGRALRYWILRGWTLRLWLDVRGWSGESLHVGVRSCGDAPVRVARAWQWLRCVSAALGLCTTL